MRRCPLPRSISIKTVWPQSVRNCGVNVVLTSCTGANAVTTSETGDTTRVCELPSSQRVCIDNESLPTGIDKRSEEHTSELQSRGHLVCRLLLEKKKNKTK